MINSSDIMFEHPMCMQIIGATLTGKTHLVFQILKERKK